jgi:hypothetical protein
MMAFYRDVLQLEVILERPGATWFRLGDGAEVHVYGPEDADHDFFGSSPVAGFWVDSFRAARYALEVAEVEFIYAEPQRAEGRAWQHVRAQTATFTRSSGLTIWAAQQARPNPNVCSSGGELRAGQSAMAQPGGRAGGKTQLASACLR